jgi:hypothetical protein
VGALVAGMGSGLFVVVLFVPPVLALHDSMSYPQKAWTAIGHRRWAAVFMFFPINVLLAVYYFLRLAPKLRRHGRIPQLERGTRVRFVRGPSKGRTAHVEHTPLILRPTNWLVGYVALRWDDGGQRVFAHRGLLKPFPDELSREDPAAAP